MFSKSRELQYDSNLDLYVYENKANGTGSLNQSVGISQNNFPIPTYGGQRRGADLKSIILDEPDHLLSDNKYVVSRLPIPTLVDVIKKAKETREKLNKLCQENKPLFDKIMESAKQAGLLFNEFGNLILCRIDLQPRDLERDWHDYFLIEESIGSWKALTFAEQNRYGLDINYHRKVEGWVVTLVAWELIGKVSNELKWEIEAKKSPFMLGDNLGRIDDEPVTFKRSWISDNSFFGIIYQGHAFPLPQQESPQEPKSTVGLTK